MDELTLETADILDNILKIALENGVATPNNLPPLNNDFVSKTKEIIARDYTYYISLIKDYDVAEVNIYLGNGFQINPYDVKTLQFYKKGGFNYIYKQKLIEEKRAQEITEIEYRKLKWDEDISKFQAKTKWWPLIISIISLGIAITAILSD